MRGYLTALLAVCVLVGPVAAATEAGPGLWRFDLADGKLTRLGDGASIAWSAALQRVVYLQRLDNRTSRLCTMRADGTGRSVLVAKVRPCGGWAQASADGRFIAVVGVDYAADDGQAFPTWPVMLTVYRADGRHVRGPDAIGRWEFEQYQPVGGMVNWSPTGHRLAVTPNLPDQRVPYLLDVATGQRQKFTGLPDAQHRQTWTVNGRTFLLQTLWQPTMSGDGRWLAFSHRDGVLAVAADGSQQRQLLARDGASLSAVPDSGDFVLSPDGQPAVRRLALDGSTVRTWAWPHGWAGRPAATATRVCWYGQAKKDGNGPEVAGLWLGDADGEVKRCVRLPSLDEISLWMSEPPSWGDAGQSILFSGTPSS